MLDGILIKNISSLFSIRIASYLIPLVTLPYLVRILEPEGFGILGLSLAIIQYFIVLVNYGFDLQSAKKVAQDKHNVHYVSKIFWNVTTLRVIFSIIGIILLYIASLTITLVADIYHVVCLAYIAVIGNALFPQWLYQGKEQLGSISAVRIVLQFITIPLTFIFVKSTSDIAIAALIWAFPYLSISVYSFYLIFKRKWIMLIIPNYKDMVIELKDSWELFISSFTGSMYLNSIPIILGFVSGPISVAIYVAAEKLLSAAIGVCSSVSSAFYPRISAQFAENQDAAVKLINYAFKLQVLIGLVIGIGLFSLSPLIINILYGQDFTESTAVLKILSFIPLFINAGSVLGIQTLLVFGYKKEFSSVYVRVGLLSLFITIPLTYFYDYTGTAIAVLTIEMIVALYFFILVRQKEIPILQHRFKMRAK